MIAQRQLARAVPRASAQLRTTMQRRLASTENAFIRERREVKEHAAGTTGNTRPPRYPSPLTSR
jgi:cytochrome c oxidase subunit 6a